jgi:predicted phosphodiesterase
MTDDGVIAVLADVHGNRWALEAVLADARAAGARRFVDLGDCVMGPLDPRGSAERLMDLTAVTVSGNGDREVVQDPALPAGAGATYARDQLTAEQLAWQATLPATAWVTEGVLACHGSPTDDSCYLLEQVHADGHVARRAPAAVRDLLGDEQADVVLCGHTHLPRMLPLADGTTVINPGSVGLPGYDHHFPVAHVMESGSPLARYALLHLTPTGWSPELRAIPYPWATAAAAARDRGREDWAIPLETGIALPTLKAG